MNADDDDQALFRAAVEGTRPHKHENAPPPGKKIPPIPVHSLRNERDALYESLVDDPLYSEHHCGDELWFARAGVQNKTLKRLRKGDYSVGAELDLHGLIVAEAKSALKRFLLDVALEDIRCVRIIHGKGLRSENGIPVLKGKLDIWLRQNNNVLAFTSARPVDGGTGAVYVLVRIQ